MPAAVDAADRDSFATPYHAPVLLTEVLAACATATVVLDGTLGGGGHTAALATAGKRVIALDRDAEAIAVARSRLGSEIARGQVTLIHANYADIDREPALAGVMVDAVLLDLGVSSHHLDADERGFSFRTGAALDMRMGADALQTAADLLNTADVHTLARIFKEYGDEPRAARLARDIVHRRATRPFADSDDLVNAIRGALGAKSGPADFARLFQAVRIAVNDELDGLARALPALRDRLTPGGVLCVIAYHSGEDRVVKHAFRDWSVACTCPPLTPRCICGGVARGHGITRKAITAGAEETQRNVRARSARMRVWQRAG